MNKLGLLAKDHTSSRANAIADRVFETVGAAVPVSEIRDSGFDFRAKTHLQVFDHDQVYPRDEENRYRLYARRRDNELVVLATSPDPGGIGAAIVQLHEDAKIVGKALGDQGQIGVLDVMPNGEPAEKGEWIVKPWSVR